MRKSVLGWLLVAAASVSMGDVVLPNTSTIADIQSAIDNAQPGEVVTLADGTYAFDRTLYVTNGVTLTGSGRDACILAGSGTTPLATALVIDHADACVKNLTVSNITTTTWYNYTGVGAQIKSGLLTQARVTGCKAPAGGRTAGVTLEDPGAVMTHCLVDHNEGTGGSNIGGVRIHLGGGKMANCLVWANSGVNAGGVSLKPTSSGPVKIVNCTIVGNTATVRGGGVENDAPSQYFWYNNVFYGPEVVNTIIAGNTAPTGADLYFGFSDEASRTASLFNCLCPTETYGANPQTGDPLFVSAGTGDFHLQSGSPARNAGDAAKAESVLGYNLAGTTDFYGLDRVLESAVDIGCAEFDPTLVACSIVKSKDPVFTGETVTLTASVSGLDLENDIVYYSWTIRGEGTGSSETRSGSPVVLNMASPDTYEVRLTVRSTQRGESVDAVPATFVVLQNTIYVTSAANPDCAYPYSTPGTAATNLNEALLAAFEGVKVVLDEGTHNVFTNVSIPKGVTVRGAGRDRTTIYAAQPFYPVVRINGAGAILKDATVAHGRMSESWKSEPVGVLIGDDGGTMADCRVTDCSNNGCWRVHGAVKMTGSDALVTRCLIDGNTMMETGNTVGQNTSGGIHATAGRIENCVITNNVGMAFNGANASGLYLEGPVVVLNCTVLDNRMGKATDEYGVDYGGGVQAANASAVVRNCIIDGNLNGDGTETNYFGNGASFSYCLSSDAAPEGSVGCIVARPVFDKRNPLHLAYRTPGRSQGSAVGYEDRLLNATDFFGQPRVKFVSPKGVADIDIGAAESKFIPDATLLIFR